MSTYPAFIVDAFTSKKFAGNQAAVVLSDMKLPDEEYQKIAAEFNLSETAYPLPLDKPGDFKNASRFLLRWFTPTTEVPLCGHATLATSHVLINEIGNVNDTIHFECKHGELVVKKSPTILGALTMNFPQYHEIVDLISKDNVEVFPKAPSPDFIHDILKIVAPSGYLHVSLAKKARKLVVVLDPNMTKEEFEKIQAPKDALIQTQPDGEMVKGVLITLAPKDPIKQGFVGPKGEAVDFASRNFAPWYGIPEDPATGKHFLDL